MSTNRPANTRAAATPAAAPEEPAVPQTKKTFAEQRREEMKSTSSALRNQVSVEDVMDFQLLSNTPAEMIAAMTGKTLDELQERAEMLEVTLKGPQAGDFRPAN